MPKKKSKIDPTKQVCACSRPAVKKGQYGYICAFCQRCESKTHNIGGEHASDPSRKYKETYSLGFTADRANHSGQ